MAFTKSALFESASRKVQHAVVRQFRATEFGQLVANVNQTMQSGRPSNIIRGALARYAKASDPNAVLRQIMGAEFGTLTREVQRYARAGGAQRALVEQFLDQLGPSGKLIKSLVDPAKTTGLTRELKAATNLIRAFGGEVLPGKGKEWDFADLERGYRAALARLESYGFQAVGSNGPPRRAPEPEEGRSTIDVQLSASTRGKETKYGRVPADHPMLTGEMVLAPSSTNVYEFGYDIENLYLYVRFQVEHEKGTRGGPGSMYRYSGVTPEEFLALYRVRASGNGQGGASTPGTWVWDVLRERGTVSGHKKDYELVGIVGGYVPRKATLRAVMRTTNKRTGKPLKHPKKEGMEEWYIQRTVRTHEGRMAHSVLPTTRVVSPRGPRF